MWADRAGEQNGGAEEGDEKQEKQRETEAEDEERGKRDPVSSHDRDDDGA